MNHKVRVALATAAAGALSCSLIAPASAATTTDNNGWIHIGTGSYAGRVAGADRFGTAVAASQALRGVQRDTVILAGSEAWVDTLAATPLADLLDTTVLYTRTNALEAKTQAELTRLKDKANVKTVLIVGGENVVSKAVADALALQGFTVDRIGGSDRYETALLLAAEAVDYYEQSHPTAPDAPLDLKEARAHIRALQAAEAKYQAALEVWAKKRGESDAALVALREKQAAVTAANQALAALTSQIKPVDPTAPTQAEINGLTTDVVNARNAVLDAQAVRQLVNAATADYAAVAGLGFQDDTWNELLAEIGSKTYTVKLVAGDKTDTLSNLTAGISLLSAAAASEGTTTTVKQVEVFVSEEIVDLQKEADDLARELADAIAKFQAALEAEGHNVALQQKIAAAQAAVVAAEKAASDAETAYETARADEQTAKAAVEDALENRPKGDDDRLAKERLEAALRKNLVAALKYPAFLATGLDFADALAAGPAAADSNGTVLLTKGTEVPAATKRYLDSGADKVAVGGPASQAVPTASKKFVGKDRYETATLLANAYFDSFDVVGLASGVVAADAVVGGALVANVDSTLVLTKPNALPVSTHNFLAFDTNHPKLVVFGGPSAISNAVADAAERAVSKK